MGKSIEEKIDEIHESFIRLEPYIKKVDKLEQTVFNEGWGLAAQTKALWFFAGGAWSVILIYLKKIWN